MQNQLDFKKLFKPRNTFADKMNIKEHLNETFLIKRNSLTSRTTFFMVDILIN